MWSWWELWEQERTTAGCWSELSEAGRAVGGEMWKGCCHLLSLSRGNGKFWLRCGQGMSKTLLCCQSHLAGSSVSALGQLKCLSELPAVGRAEGTLCSRAEGAHLQGQAGRRMLQAHSTGCSAATRGLSSLWVALVPCQQAHTRPVQCCPKPVFLKELIAHRYCKPVSRKFARLSLPRAVWLSGCGLACCRGSC